MYLDLLLSNTCILILLTGYTYMNGDVGKISTGEHYSPHEPLTVSTATNTSFR